MSLKREDTDDSDVQYMYEVEGKTQQEIADYYGVCQACIWKRLHPERMKEINDKSKEARRIYCISKKGKKAIKETKRRYHQTEKGKECIKRNNQSDKGKERMKRYLQTDKGKENSSKCNSKRRGLESISLNKPFPGSEFHHIDKEHGIHIPKELHRSIYHNVWTGEGMEDINAIAFGYITEETFDKLEVGDI
ncbi:hypothetical protein KAX02_08725 [candidate division WOR-3 bacterium]|nr:hypothetical protein [candidate division WOR-3 bacterium]